MEYSYLVRATVMLALIAPTASGADSVLWKSEPVAQGLEGTTKIVAGDCDGDGRSDLVSFSRLPVGTRIRYANDNAEKIVDTTLDGIVSAHLVDVDRNNQVDIAIVHAFGTKLSVIVGKGNRSWDPAVLIFEFPLPIESTAVFAADVGANMVMAAIEQNTGNIRLIALSVAEKRSSVFVETNGDFYSKRVLLLADLFNDGKMELLSNTGLGSSLGLCTIPDSPLEAKPSSINPLLLSGAVKQKKVSAISGIVTFDANNDRFPDIVTASQHPAAIMLYLNPGSREKEWTSIVIYQGKDTPAHFLNLDADSDGDQDIAVCWTQPVEGDKLWSWFEAGKAGVEWTEHVALKGKQFYSDVTTVDYNNDGQTDIVASQENSQGISVIIRERARSSK